MAIPNLKMDVLLRVATDYVRGKEPTPRSIPSRFKPISNLENPRDASLFTNQASEEKKALVQINNLLARKVSAVRHYQKQLQDLFNRLEIPKTVSDGLMKLVREYGDVDKAVEHLRETTSKYQRDKSGRVQRRGGKGVASKAEKEEFLLAEQQMHLATVLDPRSISSMESYLSLYRKLDNGQLQRIKNNEYATKQEVAQYNLFKSLVAQAKQLAPESKEFFEELQHINNELNKAQAKMATINGGAGVTVDPTKVPRGGTVAPTILGAGAEDVKSVQKDLKVAEGQLNSTTRQLQQAYTRMSELTHSFSGAVYSAFRRVLAWFLAGGLIFAIATHIRAIVGLQKEIHDSLIDIQKVTISTTDVRKRVLNDAIATSIKYGESIKDVLEVELAFARQGLGLEKRQIAIKNAILLSQAANVKLGDSVEFLTSLVRTYNLAWEDTANVISKLTAVESRYAISAQDLQDAIRKIGKTALIAGIQMDRLLGMITTVKEVTRETGTFVGNAFKTIFARAYSTETQKQLQAVGIEIVDMGGKFKSLDNILDELSGRWEQLSDATRLSIAKAFGRLRRFQVFLALMDNYDRSLKIAADAALSFGDAERKAAQEQEKYSRKIKAFQAAMQKFLGGTAGGFLDFMTSMAKLFSSIPPEVLAIVGAMVGMTAVFGLVVAAGVTMTRATGMWIASMVSADVATRTAAQGIGLFGVELVGASTKVKAFAFALKILQGALGVISLVIALGTAAHLVYSYFKAAGNEVKEFTADTVSDLSKHGQAVLDVVDVTKRLSDEYVKLKNRSDDLSKSEKTRMDYLSSVRIPRGAALLGLPTNISPEDAGAEAEKIGKEFKKRLTSNLTGAVDAAYSAVVQAKDRLKGIEAEIADAEDPWEAAPLREIRQRALREIDELYKAWEEAQEEAFKNILETNNIFGVDQAVAGISEALKKFNEISDEIANTADYFSASGSYLEKVANGINLRKIFDKAADDYLEASYTFSAGVDLANSQILTDIAEIRELANSLPIDLGIDFGILDGDSGKKDVTQMKAILESYKSMRTQIETVQAQIIGTTKYFTGDTTSSIALEALSANLNEWIDSLDKSIKSVEQAKEVMSSSKESFLKKQTDEVVNLFIPAIQLAAREWENAFKDSRTGLPVDEISNLRTKLISLSNVINQQSGTTKNPIENFFDTVLPKVNNDILNAPQTYIEAVEEYYKAIESILDSIDEKTESVFDVKIDRAIERSGKDYLDNAGELTSAAAKLGIAYGQIPDAVSRIANKSEWLVTDDELALMRSYYSTLGDMASDQVNKYKEAKKEVEDMVGLLLEGPGKQLDFLRLKGFLNAGGNVGILSPKDRQFISSNKTLKDLVSGQYGFENLTDDELRQRYLSDEEGLFRFHIDGMNNVLGNFLNGLADYDKNRRGYAEDILRDRVTPPTGREQGAIDGVGNQITDQMNTIGASQVTQQQTTNDKLDDINKTLHENNNINREIANVMNFIQRNPFEGPPDSVRWNNAPPPGTYAEDY